MDEIKIIDGENKAIAIIDNIQVGECEYVDENNTWNIIHTKVDDNYRGKGIAKKLFEYVLKKAEENNKHVIAKCSYAKKQLENNENI